MRNKVESRLDALALALGGISMVGACGGLPFGALPMVTNDRINAAWDEKLGLGSPPDCPEIDPDCANAGWAT